MPLVTIKPLNVVRMDAKVSEWQVEAEDLQTAVDEFVRTFGTQIRPALLEGAGTNFRKEVKVILNGVSVEPGERGRTTLEEGDVIHMALALPGG
ncbi:MAG: hypothetical protein ACTSU5_12230 [Promethearchaeota archaeon]